ncbi:MAG: UvrD-helicase domain-containing protein, partial [Oscillospiraceae bacterium]|nr:UvrD-helicase domain-containing protein [Oscillospiraceae bacterium]
MGRLNTPQWTSAQKAAIGDRGHALLLSAAAGSGKTAVLVERAVGLMCQKKDPVPAEALLIVTFTNAAAAELRSRLAKKLNERLAAEPPASPRMHWLRRQQMMLGRAAICTIDAFCLQLLQQNFRALDIPPDFSTADEGTLFTLRANALAETMEAACADEEFCRFADLFGRARSDSGAADAIQRLYAFLRSLPDYRAELERWCRMWEDDTPLEQTALCRAVSELVVEELNSAKWYMEQADERCSEAETRGMTKLFEKVSPEVSDELDCVEERLEDFSRGFWDRGVDRLRRWKREVVRFTAPRVKADSTDAELKEIVHTVTQKELIVHMRDEANSHIKKLQALELPTSGEYERDRQEAAPLVRALARAVLDYDDRLWAAKKEHKVLDFADFEHLALSLLWDGSRVTSLGRQIAAGYQAVMVDEYQDTNRLQDTLYRCLAAPDGSNLFLVGDM